MLRQLERSRAVAEAVALCRPQVVSAYPISPQTHIVEALSDLVRTGELAPCEYLMVESEFGALSACIAAGRSGTGRGGGSRIAEFKKCSLAISATH